MTRPAPIEYIMEDPREAMRLAQKVDPRIWIDRYIGRHLSAGAEVLSVGCGPGNILRTLADLHPTIGATGVDISADRIAQAREHNGDNPRVRFVRGDARQMDFASDAFDLVYTRMLLQYLPDKEGTVAEMVRVTKPGGRVLLQDLDGQLVWHYPEDPEVEDTVQRAIQALAETGFDPFVGRKLFGLARNAGLEDLQVQAESYHLIAGAADAAVLEQWELKLEIAQPLLARVFGSTREAARRSRYFLDYLRRPDTFTYSNVFTITGEKPL